MKSASSKRAVWVVLLFFGLAAGLVWWKISRQPAASGGPLGAGSGGKTVPLSVTAWVAFRDSLPLENEFSGNLLPRDEIQLMPEMAGRIIKLNIQEGRMVQKGALLLSLFDADLKAQQRKLRLQEGIALRNLERARALLQTGSGTQLDADNAENVLNNIRADLEILEVNLEKTAIHAPFSGQLGFCNLSEGAWVNPGTAITWLRDTRRLKLEFSVPEKYADQFQPGTRVAFTRGSSAEVFMARVYALDPGYRAETQSLAIRAELDNAGGKLKPGEFVRVKLSGAVIADALMLPDQSIIPDNRGKKVILFRGGKAEFREVKTGIRIGGRVRILSGVSEGDTVLTTGLMFAKPGSELKITQLEK